MCGTAGHRAELWVLMVLVLKAQQLFSISQLNLLAETLGTLLALLLKLDSRLSEKNGKGKGEQRRRMREKPRKRVVLLLEKK